MEKYRFYNNAEQAAEKMDIRKDIILALCQSGLFGRKVSNTWLITDRELADYQDGIRTDPADLVPLYDADAVIKELNISRARFYRLIEKGEIESLRFGNRGGHPNIIFTKDQLLAAKKAIAGAEGTVTREVAIDKHIRHRSDGRFAVIGTGKHYKSRTIARARARQMGLE